MNRNGWAAWIGIHISGSQGKFDVKDVANVIHLIVQGNYSYYEYPPFYGLTCAYSLPINVVKKNGIQHGREYSQSNY